MSQNPSVPQNPTGDGIMAAAQAAAREVFPDAAPTASDHANQLANRLCELLAPPGCAKVNLIYTPTTEPANPDRRCRRCGATSGLVMLPHGPLDPREWECAAGCKAGQAVAR